MNWLAHTLLSAPDLEFRLGNLLADLIPRPERPEMSPRFRAGMACHQRIDAFTDGHPVVRRSKARLAGSQRRFAGILVDVCYDHVLACHWQRYCAQPLPAFAAQLHAKVAQDRPCLPEPAAGALARLVRRRHLEAYRHPAGMETALRRIETRLSPRLAAHFSVPAAMATLHAQQAGLTADFHSFFPELQAMAAQWMTAAPAH